MSLGWPQLLYIALSCAALYVAIDDHGKPKSGRHNAWYAAAATAIAWALLWWGGFFQ